MAGNPGAGSGARGRLEPLAAALACLDALPDAERFAAGRERLAELEARLAEGRFHLAVLGQFKRGKSTLLNALVGAPLLPASVLPLTAVPTFLHHGPRPSLHVVFRDRPPERCEPEGANELRTLLERFASEAGNPGNRLGVARVEVGYPAAALRGGAVLIDTPGIGSSLRHNTDTTLAFLPQCDAALFVLSADPPPTEAELAFLAQVQRQAPRLFFVLNKVDYLGPEERGAAAAFLRRTLAEQAGVAEPVIFPVSATRGLAAREQGDEELWRESGMAALERALREFLARDKDAALQEAVRRKAALELAELGLQLDLEERSLTLPLSELQARLEALRTTAREAEDAREALPDLLALERKRLRAWLEAEVDRLRERAVNELQATLSAALEEGEEAPEALERRARTALAEAIPRFFEPQAQALSEALAARLEAALEPHRARTEALAAALRGRAAELFELPTAPATEAEATPLLPRLHWVIESWPSDFSSLSLSALARLLPPRQRQRRLEAQLRERLGDLVKLNVEKLRWNLLQHGDAALARAGQALGKRLEATVAATYGAVAGAAERRERSEAQAQGELAALRAARAKLAALEVALER